MHEKLKSIDLLTKSVKYFLFGKWMFFLCFLFENFV